MNIGDLILVLIFTIVICSFILYWVVKSAIDNSEIARKIKGIEIDLNEIKQNRKNS